MPIKRNDVRIANNNMLSFEGVLSGIDDLSSAWRMADSPEESATDGDFWVHTPGYVFDKQETLGLSKPDP